MLFLIAGVIVGSFLALGPPSWLAWAQAPIDHVLGSLIVAADRGMASLLSLLPLDDFPKASESLALAVAVMMPGILAVVLASAARASLTVRRAASALFVLGAVASWWALPFAQAAVLTVLAFVVAGVASMASGMAMTLPLAALSTVLSLRHIKVLIAQEDAEIVDVAERFAVMSGIPNAELWVTILTFFALAPFAFALWAMIRN